MNLVTIGKSFDFDAELEGEGVSGFTVPYSVLQYPGQSPALNGTMTYSNGKFIGTLTAAQTATLTIGQWFIYIEPSDSDEDLDQSIKIYVTKAWT